MKTLPLMLMIFLSSFLFAQRDIEKNLHTSATTMLQAFNSKDFKTYVTNYLIPEGGDEKYKEEYIAGMANYYKNDTCKAYNQKILKTSKYNGQYQGIVQTTYHERAFYTIGLSNDEGKNWNFTMLLAPDVQFDLIVLMVPGVDPSFSFIDPKIRHTHSLRSRPGT